MKIIIENKPVHIPDEEIKVLCDSLQISKDEAIAVWLDDHDITVNQEQEELNKKAAAVKINHGAAAAEKKPRKPREKKENFEKKAIIDAIYKGISQNISEINNISIRNDEKYIDFTINNVEYTINLVAHRAKKA